MSTNGSAVAESSRIVVARSLPNEPRLWTPSQGASGLVLVARQHPLLAVLGGRIVSSNTTGSDETHAFGGRLRPVNLGGLVIMNSTRQKEPTRVVGHPDLASGASVQRGDTLYVSVAEAVYRESRGEENVEVHLTPTSEDAEALADLRARARHRWENDRLPDGWTRPLPPLPVQQMPTPKENGDVDIEGMPEELRRLANELKAKEQRRYAEA